IISDEIESLALILERDRLADHAKVVSDVENPARLNAGKNTHALGRTFDVCDRTFNLESTGDSGPCKTLLADQLLRSNQQQGAKLERTGPYGHPRIQIEESLLPVLHGRRTTAARVSSSTSTVNSGSVWLRRR